MNQKDRAKEELSRLVQAWKDGQIAEAVAMATFPYPTIPAARWSFTNRVLMALHGTGDARGYRQWQEVDRYVKKGSRALYILAPHLVKDREAEPVEDEAGKHQPPQKLVGYLAIPVFAYEDTKGKELPPEQRQPQVPDLPLLEVGKKFNLEVRAEPFSGDYFGVYANRNGKKEIRLATPEERTFFHELAHAAHERWNGSLKMGQDAHQEVVAELTAAVLCRLAGRSEKDFSGNCYRYIEHYARQSGKSVESACLAALQEVGGILELIFEEEPHDAHPSTTPR